MKLALLKDNPLNPGHLPAFATWDPAPKVGVWQAPAVAASKRRQADFAAQGMTLEPMSGASPVGSWMRNTLQRLGMASEDKMPDVALANCDLLHSWELYSDATALALTAKQQWDIPLCVSVWDNVPFALERNPARRRRKERAVAEADFMLVHDPAARAMLEDAGVPAARIFTCDPGLDTDRYAPGARARQRYGLALDDFVLLVVGRRLPAKAIELLLLVLRELCHDTTLHRKRKLRLWFVGVGNEKARIQARARQLGVASRCAFTPPLSYTQMPSAYRSADVVVLPPAPPECREEYIMHALEAMACATPVVAADDDSYAAFTEAAAARCPTDDISALHHTLRRFVLEHAYSRNYGSRGRKQILHRFDRIPFSRFLETRYRDWVAMHRRT